MIFTEETGTFKSHRRFVKAFILSIHSLIPNVIVDTILSYGMPPEPRFAIGDTIEHQNSGKSYIVRGMCYLNNNWYLNLSGRALLMRDNIVNLRSKKRRRVDDYEFKQ